MSVGLLDVNVLVALFDAGHVHHEEAHRWFGMNQKVGWATCPMTINGCVRILSHPAYPTVNASSGEVAAALRQFCSTAHHHFWADTVSLLDETLFQPGWIGGPRAITDVYLLGLAVRNHGRLVTFDRGIPLKAVKGASLKNLAVLNG